MLLRELKEYETEMIALRRDLHTHPELSFEEHRTQGIVAAFLRQWGYEVSEGLAGTGVVGSLRKGVGGRSIGIRADMDALPIHELNEDGPACSCHAGKMHACGHDGHTAILLMTARYLAERADFNGTVHLIFQPAEESRGGAKVMIDEGLFTRFPCDAVFGLHNMPYLPFGAFAVQSGAMMASADMFTITVTGKGGHGSEPDRCIDPILAGSAIVLALQSIVSRNVSPKRAAVISVGSFNSGSAPNIIPETAEMKVSVRTLSPQDREHVLARIHEVVLAQAASYGAQVDIRHEFGYPVLMNNSQQSALVADVIRESFGDAALLPEGQAIPLMASEDFSFMTEACPGAFIIMGTSVTGQEFNLHHPRYQFNDDAIVPGAALWVNLVQRFLL